MDIFLETKKKRARTRFNAAQLQQLDSNNKHIIWLISQGDSPTDFLSNSMICIFLKIKIFKVKLVQRCSI